jgi:type IV pilus assembly protein PilA
MSRRITAVFFSSLVLIAGCGGDDEPDSQTVKTDDNQAKSNARNLVSEVEVCYVENQDYSACEKPAGTQLPIGSKEGEVEVTKAATDGYTVVAHSKSGNTFTLAKSGSGTKRTCDAGGSEEGGCKDGRW